MLRVRPRYLSSIATTKVLTPIYNKVHPDFQNHVDSAQELTALHTHLLKCKYGLVKKEDLKKFDIKVPKIGKLPPGKVKAKPEVRIEKNEVEFSKHEILTIESFFKACKLKTDRLLETIKSDPKPDLDFSAYDDEALPNTYSDEEAIAILPWWIEFAKEIGEAKRNHPTMKAAEEKYDDMKKKYGFKDVVWQHESGKLNMEGSKMFLRTAVVDSANIGRSDKKLKNFEYVPDLKRLEEFDQTFDKLVNEHIDKAVIKEFLEGKTIVISDLTSVSYLNPDVITLNVLDQQFKIEDFIRQTAVKSEHLLSKLDSYEKFMNKLTATTMERISVGNIYKITAGISMAEMVQHLEVIKPYLENGTILKLPETHFYGLSLIVTPTRFAAQGRGKKYLTLYENKFMSFFLSKITGSYILTLNLVNEETYSRASVAREVGSMLK